MLKVIFASEEVEIDNMVLSANPLEPTIVVEIVDDNCPDDVTAVVISYHGDDEGESWLIETCDIADYLQGTWNAYQKSTISEGQHCELPVTEDLFLRAEVISAEARMVRRITLYR